jgi:large subunit ribosomal protein L5
MKKNIMNQIEIEKMVLNCGGTDEKGEQSTELLKMITEGRKILEITSTRRLPAFGLSPGKKSGRKVTLRDTKKILELLKRFFAAVDNQISNKKIVENQFNFGIHEYIEVPGLEYRRDIGMLGFDIAVVFTRKGKRVKLKKVKQGKYPKKQNVTKEEIVEYIQKNLGVEVVQ